MQLDELNEKASRSAEDWGEYALCIEVEMPYGERVNCDVERVVFDAEEGTLTLIGNAV